MNNNIDRINKGIAQACFEDIKVAVEDGSSRKEILRGGGSSGGVMTRLLMPRPLKMIRISEDALKICIEKGVSPFDYFILTDAQRRKKHGNFFSSNKKNIKESHKIGHYLTGDHNSPNSQIIADMFEEYVNNKNASWRTFLNILNQQSYDLITLEENKRIDDAGFKMSGTRSQRDALTSKKIEFTDVWLTPHDVIDQFFKISKLNRDECLDPCAADGRWLSGKGMSIDILPQSKNVKKIDFLDLDVMNMPNKIKHIVGNIPFSLTDEFIEKAFELRGSAYFLVNGDTIFNKYPLNIKEVYIFSGLEGNQKDNRSRSEFDVPFLMKSALWTCIVHLTKKKQMSWKIRKDISNSEKRDGYHVALGQNTFIESDVPVDKNKKIKRINVKSTIVWKGGKKIKVDGEWIDLRNFTFL